MAAASFGEAELLRGRLDALCVGAISPKAVRPHGPANSIAALQASTQYTDSGLGTIAPSARMTLAILIPGGEDLRLNHLMLDVNGTLTNRGMLLEGVTAAVAKLLPSLDIHLVSADTFGTLDSIADLLRATGVRAGSGDDKLRKIDELGPRQTAVIGNGANDVLVLRAAALGIVVIGPEGASSQAIRAADVVCLSILDALNLLLEPRALVATLRR